MSPSLLLINPAMISNGNRLPNAGGIATMEPLALAYVAAVTPAHWEIRIVDEVLEDIPLQENPDLVGLTSLTITVPRAYEIAEHFRARGIPVAMGGVHATLLPDEAANYVDAVVIGEAESSWPSLIEDFEAGELQPRYVGAVSDLKGLCLPRRDLYRHHYFLQLVSASRGCRYRCEFCTLWKLEGGRYRARPPGEVLAEMMSTNGNGRRPPLASRPILFTDENVFTDREWAHELFTGLAERGRRRPFAVQASLDIADDEEMLTLLQKCGCMTILIGFESVSEESLRLMRKGVNLRIGVDRYKEKISKLHDHGLMSSGSFMFGNDGDEPDIFERTVDFVLEAGVDIAHFGLLTPTPGTDLHDRLVREGRLLCSDFPADYRRYDLQTAVFRPLKMTPEQLEEGVVWATRAVGSGSAAVRRAWHTLRQTKNPIFAAIAYRWNRSGLYHRVFE
jgi:radical SAM superfamily enzyme YgiQ (UPF0313 family)